METSKTTRWATSILGVALGGLFLAHGLAKFLVFTLPGTAQFFESVGFPGWTATPVALLEVVGGASLIVGAASRWVALALIPIVVGATRVHAPNGFLFNNPGGGWEFPVLVAVALVVLALLATRTPVPR